MTTNKTSQNSGMRSRNNAKRPKAGVASKELQEARRRRRQREVFRNRIIFGGCIAIILALIIFLVVKAAGLLLGNGKAADNSTLTFKEDGQVVFEEITDFDTSTYSKSELKDYAKGLISSFNETYGSKAITLDKLSVKGDKAYIKTTYKDAECYTTFTSYDTFNGTYEDAVNAGYDFTGLFSEVADGTILEAGAVDADTVFADLKVAVVSENISVIVPGDVKYISNAYTDISDTGVITITQPDENEDATELVFIIYQ
ncbi:MAG: hypothetical protein E7273_05390 [Pseudobutyrivibrio ruminis]|nr:hypothetical protein [Pseudobutyrivibrio ruminis]